MHPEPTEPEWARPGPGTWTLDRSHVVAPGPIVRHVLSTGMDVGMAEGCERFGAPIAGMKLRWVNGHFYRRIVPLVGAARDLPTPPPPLLWLATRLHPEFRRREKTARDTLEHHRWNEETDRWEREWCPRITAENERLTDIEIEALDDVELAEHLTEVHDHLVETTTLHFRLSVTSMGPMGLLMVNLRNWGLDPADTFDALVHASPATRSASVAARGIADALREQGFDPEQIATLEDIDAAGGEAATRLAGYLRTHGWRLTTGYDLQARMLCEVPGLIVNAVRRSPSPADADASRAERALSALRDRVSAEHHEAFDRLVAQARASYGLRDANGPITYEWPAGLLRRALLVAGDRLTRSGALHEEGHVFELSVDEIADRLHGSATPTLAEIADRAAQRRTWATLDAPPQLGPDEVLPPVSVMPPYLGQVTEVILTVMPALEAEAGYAPLHGLGLGTDSYRGTARVVTVAEDAFASMEPGDVLVAPFTSPTYNAVLAMAGAVVTEEGGLLCHAAVIARELGLPAVIGAAGAVSLIPDGAEVVVDPVAGRVEVLSAHDATPR
ncbi:MAG TPA: PEP-utilizing enzyme [Acidimicrobiales bacterium]|nr:PEP-utilizing enzyme [Acidimicrobiales bacterium]